jgi:hypothetical protein
MNRIKALFAFMARVKAQFDRDVATWQWKVNGIDRRRAPRKAYPGLDGDELRTRLREVNAAGERVESGVALGVGAIGQTLPIVSGHDATTQV